MKQISIIAACLLLLGAPLTADAKVYDTYAEASSQVTDAGYVAFIYPKGWDRYGEKLCRKLVADRSVQAALGNAAVLLAPVYQNRNAETNAQCQKVMGSLAYPHDMGDISYPAIVFYEKGGRQYASLHGEELMNASVEGVAKSIKLRFAAKKKQDDILRQANATSDPEEKSRFYWQTTRVKWVNWPGGLQDAMRKYNPEDKGGYIAALNFGFPIKDGESAQQLMKRLQEVLKNPKYSARQKQNACAATIGHLRRSLGMIAGAEYISKCAKAMQKLDPDSTLGMAAPVVLRDWVREYRYGQGWSPEVLPGCDSPIVMHGVPIEKKGTYTVNFKIVTGRDVLMIKSVRLMEDGRCVAEDSTARNVTWSQTQQTFTLNVKKNVRNATLEFVFPNPPNQRSTWGEITVSSK